MLQNKTFSSIMSIWVIMSGSLKIIMGPMFAGKTTSLLNEISKYNSKDILVINHSVDNRYENEKISTHITYSSFIRFP